jgi:hypothetical protein
MNEAIDFSFIDKLLDFSGKEGEKPLEKNVREKIVKLFLGDFAVFLNSQLKKRKMSLAMGELYQMAKRGDKGALWRFKRSIVDIMWLYAYKKSTQHFFKVSFCGNKFVDRAFRDTMNKFYGSDEFDNMVRYNIKYIMKKPTPQEIQDVVMEAPRKADRRGRDGRNTSKPDRIGSERDFRNFYKSKDARLKDNMAKDFYDMVPGLNGHVKNLIKNSIAEMDMETLARVKQMSPKQRADFYSKSFAPIFFSYFLDKIEAKYFVDEPSLEGFYDKFRKYFDQEEWINVFFRNMRGFILVTKKNISPI